MEDNRILVDTSIIIDFLRKKDKKSTILWKIKENYYCFMSSITLFELHCGVKSEKHFSDIAKLCLWIESIPFEDKIARLSAIIYSQLKRNNQLIEFRDIFIAATAIAEDLYLSTLNREHFKRIEDLKLL